MENPTDTSFVIIIITTAVSFEHSLTWEPAIEQSHK